MHSIMVDDTEHCVICGGLYPDPHHIFFGDKNRPVSDRYGLVIPLCNKHHTGSGDCPHKNRVIDLAYKCWGQSVYESKIGDRIDFRREFGRSYL